MLYGRPLLDEVVFERASTTESVTITSRDSDLRSASVFWRPPVGAEIVADAVAQRAR